MITLLNFPCDLSDVDLNLIHLTLLFFSELHDLGSQLLS